MIRLANIQLLLLMLTLFMGACTSSFLKLEKKEEDFKKNVEFDEKVIIKELPAEAGNSNNQVIDLTSKLDTPKVVEKTKITKPKKIKQTKAQKKAEAAAAAAAAAATSAIDAPEASVTSPPPVATPEVNDIENKDGINGRRPIKDPFRVGEEVVHELHYFKVAAGELKLKVGPFVEVNGRRSYTFTTEIESSSMFSSFYSVKDSATTYVDYMDLIPHVFKLSVKETGQIKDAKGLFDQKNNKATYWEKKFTKKNGHEEEKKEWDIPSFSQNVYSAAYYMRLFKWDLGKEYSFRVANAGENIVFKGKAIRKEKLETEIGDFDTIVVKPEFSIQGVFRPVGDIYFWLSDDDRKYILRIESSIKIGTIVSEIVKLTPGK